MNYISINKAIALLEKANEQFAADHYDRDGMRRCLQLKKLLMEAKTSFSSVSRKACQQFLDGETQLREAKEICM